MLCAWFSEQNEKTHANSKGVKACRSHAHNNGIHRKTRKPMDGAVETMKREARREKRAERREKR